jgi:DNA (cytosine-5)-methyltransferase 1
VTIAAVDLFCGAGGLSEGLQQAGIMVTAGVDIDPHCRYPFECNIEAAFLQYDIAEITGERLQGLWPVGSVRLLTGCAPCQPFSPYRRGQKTSHEADWPLLAEFGRLVIETRPELVTMENVTRILRSKVFLDFVAILRAEGYWVDWRSCYGPRFGLPQERRRLVLIASQLGPVKVPKGSLNSKQFRTVREAIGELPTLQAGESDPVDPLHKCRELTDLNLQRIQASKPGRTWEDWPEQLRAPCHQRASGRSFKNVYARMSWDEPSPTITTLAFNYGAGRFGHPDQDRPISLREAALLQGFPERYAFATPGRKITMSRIGRLIGNAVPPPIARAIGQTLRDHVNEYARAAEG